MNVTRIGLDLAKHVFQVHGVDQREHPVVRKQLRRDQVLAFFRTLPPCLIGLEACGGAHYWARELRQLGHDARLMAPQFVKPYVKGNKNDALDAAAICEAVGRPTMRFVAVKTEAQQDLQAAHRVRSELVQQRTAKGNQIRGLLAEYGVVVGQRWDRLHQVLAEQLEPANGGLSPALRQLLRGLQDDLAALAARVAELDRTILGQAREDVRARRLLQIPGIGPLTATALVAAVGNGRQFKRGRDLGAWLGLTPRQHSSGGKERLLGISKRGDAYLRMLLIHGARAVLNHIEGKTDGRSRWLQDLCSRRPRNIAVVALANKNARIAWALLTQDVDYQPA